MTSKHPRHWITVKSEGLYCVPGDFYIDPASPVTTALITHGHSDHARAGHKKVIATAATLAIMQARYGEEAYVQSQAMKYGEPININGVQLTFYPAGHILGSAQVKIEYAGSSLVVSGDYKRQPDPTCSPFEVQPCDVFLTEATFAMPVFIHPPIEQELSKLIESLKLHPHRCHLVGAYALGKCQRIIMTLRKMGYLKPIYLHGAMQRLCDLYQQFGMDLGELQAVTHENAADLSGEIVLCPPSALNDRWSRRFPQVMTCYASGWMQVRARAKQKGIELPLVISDHAGWDELIQTIDEVNAKEIWITHGTDEALLYYTKQQGRKAKALALLHYDEEED